MPLDFGAVKTANLLTYLEHAFAHN